MRCRYFTRCGVLLHGVIIVDCQRRGPRCRLTPMSIHQRRRRRGHVAMVSVLRLASHVILVLGAGGCFPVATPRLPQSVAAALAQNPMRSVESAHLRLYFPAGREDDARRFVANVERCATYLTRAAQLHNGVADQKMIVMMPELAYNNAFVAPRVAGYDTEAVIPTYNTADVFLLEMGLPPEPSEIACHELTHYVQFQQIAGFAWFFNALFGAVYTQQIGLDSWFDEGLAVYYETKLQPGTGRLTSPMWRGSFAAAYAGRRINGGDLHVLKRDYHAGNNYLVGSQFVRFLADRYGEEKLWKVVAVQGRSIFFPLWVDLRFWQAYGKTLSTLIDEFADEVQTNLRPKLRPPAQQMVRPAGYTARYARATDGTEAMIAQDHDSPPRLTIHGPDGQLRADVTLTDVVPPRRLVIASTSLASGLSFTADARWLYFVAVDAGVTYQVARLMRYDLERDSLAVVYDDLRGTGGSITPDGARYLFAQANGDHHDLAALDLRTGTVKVLAPQRPGAFIAHPRVSPDGTRVVATQYDGARFRIVLLDAVSGAPLDIPVDGGTLIAGPVNDPSWVDNHRILFMGAPPTDVGFQVYMQDLTDGQIRRLTDAPYLAFQARAAADGTVRFLNREGWNWTLDQVPLPAPLVTQTARAPAAPEGGPAASSDAAVVVVPTGDNAPPVTATPRGVGTSPVAQPAWADGAQEENPFIDRPYSQLDRLFVPRLHGPTLQSVGRRAVSIGLVVSGNDSLSMHRWTMAGYYQSASAGGAFSGLAGYSNRQLAPFTFNLLASQIQVHDAPPVPPGQPVPANPALTLFRRDRLVTAEVERAFYGNPVTLGGLFVETYRPEDPAVLVPRRRFAGPHLGARFTGAELTPYTGPRRLFSAALDGAAYPQSWNTLGVGFIDGRIELDAVLPLPLSRRHTLSLSGRARNLLGIPGGLPLLLVGGYTSVLLARDATRPEVTAFDSPLLPPGVAFMEPLRGFEDYPLLTDRIYVADATYRYPFIIDRGTASTLALLPAFFVQQIDLELFGAAATDARDGDRHLAGGGALTLRLALWEIPFNFQYQVARRATDDHGVSQLVTLGL